MGWRYYAQRVRTGEWLDRDLALQDVQITWALSGPGALAAKVDEVTAKAIAADGYLVLEEWATAIYAEEDDEIRWGGILRTSTNTDGNTRELDIIGFAGYPKGRIYLSDEYRLWEADPFDVIRILWDYVQSDPTADLGVTVDTDVCPVRLGDPSPGPMPVRSNYPAGTAGNSDFEAALVEWNNYSGEPYSLAWWNQQDCGDEIDGAVSSSGSEYLEQHWWLDDEKTEVRHHIMLGYPGVGYRRTDLRFMEGENVLIPPVTVRNGEEYANQILALGNGEERHMLRASAGTTHPIRLRRDKVVGAQDVMVPKTLEMMAAVALKVSQDIIFFDSIEVMDHPNAPLGSFNVGDEIRLQTYSGFEQIDRWVLVNEITTSPETGNTMTLTVSRL